MYWSSKLYYTALHSKLHYTSQRLACSQNHFNPEWMSLLTDLILPRVTMISPSYNDFTESHSLNIRWSSHLRWPAWPFTESPTLRERLHFGSILGKYLNYSSPASYLIYGKYLKLHIWSMANILSSGRQHKLKGEHWRATQIEGWSQTLGI